MQKDQNAPISYKVVKASGKQIELLYETQLKNSKTSKEQRADYIVFLAFSEDEEIIGRVIAMEKAVPPPLYGVGWFILNVNVQPECRRQGIASALLKTTIEHAKQANVLYLYGSADPTLRAHMLYKKHNFCFSRYGKIAEDASNPLEYGNYHHVFFSCLNRSETENKKRQTDYRITKADKKQLNYIFDEHLLRQNPEFYKGKRDEILGFAAVDGNANIVGFAVVLPMKMDAPLDGEQWRITHIFVNPSLRKQKIGSALIQELIKTAKETNSMQVITTRPDGEEAAFWYKNNFDICFWGKIPGTDKCPFFAGARLK